MLLHRRKFCECNCGQVIQNQPHHKYSGTPKYLRGHYGRGIKRPSQMGRIPWNKGKKGLQVGWCKGLTKETSKSIILIAQKVSGDRNPMRRPEVAKKHSFAMMGKPGYWKGKKRPDVKEWCGGEKNYNWNPDREKRFAPYTEEFAINVPKVRKRDNYICQLCFNSGKTVHHIDTDKGNGKITNLVNLCCKCNTQLACKDKGIWSIFYQPYLQVIAEKRVI